MLRFDGSSSNNGPQTAVSSVTIAVDNRTDLNITWTVPAGLQTGTTSTFTLTFNVAVPATEVIVNSFTFPADVTMTVAPTTGTNTVYTITVTNPTDAQGSYGITLDANTISATTTYKAGPTADVSTGAVSYDTRQVITATWATPTSSSANPITGATSTFTLTLNKAVLTTDISTADFSPGTLTISSITPVSPVNGLASAYTIVVTNPTDSRNNYTLSFNRNAVPDGTSYKQGPDPAVAAGILYYDTRTRVTVSSFQAQTGTQSGTQSTFRLQLNLSVPATEITVSDFTVSNTAATILSVSPTSGNSQDYTITVTNPTNAHGNYTLTLAMNAVADGTGYLEGPPSAETSTAVAFDTRTAVSVVSFTPPSGTQSGATSTLTLTLDRNVPASELQNTDFLPSNMLATINSITPTTGNQNVYSVVVNNPSSGNGTYTVSLRGNAITSSPTYLTGPIANFASTDVTYDRRPVLTGSWTTEPSGTQTSRH